MITMIMRDVCNERALSMSVHEYCLSLSVICNFGEDLTIHLALCVLTHAFSLLNVWLSPSRTYFLFI